jgi:hypothetical protein
MAYEDVTVNPDEMGGDFVQFKDNGQELEGLFVGAGPSTSQFAAERPGQCHRYTILVREVPAGGGQPLMKAKIVDPAPTHLEASLQRALSNGKLKQGCKIKIRVTGSKPTGKGNPMMLFDVKVDSEVNPAALKAITGIAAQQQASAPPPQPKPQPPPAPVEADPFA